jgi:hypothetical protein
LRSADELNGQLDEARAHLEEATADLAKEQSLEVREKISDRLTDLPDLGMNGLRAAQA